MSRTTGSVGTLQYNFLRWLSPQEPSVCTGKAWAGRSKLDLLGTDLNVRGLTVLDFGCGEGHECAEFAQRGAAKVIGIDIRPEMLDCARKFAQQHGVADCCEFTTETRSKADLVVSIDAFEHFAHPEEILDTMSRLIKPAGSIRVSFGPTWYHPLGGHLFSVFPWAHLVFSENALIRWRSDFKSDGATRFSEVAGGLNQMTIRRFEAVVESSPLQVKWLECVPIRKLRPLHNRLTREFTTSIVRCELIPKKARKWEERSARQAQSEAA